MVTLDVVIYMLCIIFAVINALFSISAEAADTEEAWQGAGSEPGLKIWRVEVSGRRHC